MGLLVATTALGQPNVTVSDVARQHFKAGVAYIDDPAGAKFEEAYREFRLAYAESPTYKILSNLGLCALNLERDGEAIDSYERFLAEAKADDIPKDKRTLMERDIAMLKASLVKVTFTGAPATLTVRDERIPSKGSSVINRYTTKDGTLSLGMHPGHHRVTASAEGYEPQTWEFEADAAGTFSHAFNLKPIGEAAASTAPPANASADGAVVAPSETKSTTSPFVYVGLAATGMFAVSAVATGLVSNSKMNDYQSVNASGTAPSHARELQSSGETYGLVSDISTGAAVLSAGATAIVYFTGSSKKTETTTAGAQWQVVPSVGAAQAGLNVWGRF